LIFYVTFWSFVMIEQKKKLRMDEIHVQSFITALSEDELLDTLRGGTDEPFIEEEDDGGEGYGGRRRKTGHDGSGCMSAVIGTC
jgi:hypothetical protein